MTIIVAGCLCVMACVSAPAESDRNDQAQALLAQTLTDDAGAGVTAAVIKDGALIWSGAAGFADVENAVALTPNTPMRIGSVSKSLTAVLLLRYAERNAIDLDADIRVLLGENIATWNGAGLSHLASHTSGVRHYDFSNFEEANNLYFKQSLSEAVAPILSERPLFEPGEKFEYSSHGYNIVGAVLERISGAPFAALFGEHVAAPLALDQTRVDHPFDLIPGRSRQYTVTVANPVFPWMEDGALINTFYRDSSDYYPSGGMLSSAEDLARFTWDVFETAFLTEADRVRIASPALLSSGEPAGFSESRLYSFGWELHLDEQGNVVSLGHDGETNGAYALIRYFPDERLVVTAVANYNVMGREPAFFRAVSARLHEIFTDQK